MHKLTKKIYNPNYFIIQTLTNILKYLNLTRKRKKQKNNFSFPVAMFSFTVVTLQVALLRDFSVKACCFHRFPRLNSPTTCLTVVKVSISTLHWNYDMQSELIPVYIH